MEYFFAVRSRAMNNARRTRGSNSEAKHARAGMVHLGPLREKCNIRAPPTFPSSLKYRYRRCRAPIILVCVRKPCKQRMHTAALHWRGKQLQRYGPTGRPRGAASTLECGALGFDPRAQLALSINLRRTSKSTLGGKRSRVRK